MSQNLFFSVIIPTLNEEVCLPKLLSDLGKQKNNHFEVLVIDGGSTDNTLAEAKEFTKKLKLKIYTNKEKGVSPQRNFGAKHAHGQYLVFFDADVRIPHNFLDRLEVQIKKQGGYLYTTRLAVDNDSQTQLALIEFTNFIVEIFNTLGKPFAPGFDIIIEKRFFEKLGGFDVTLKLAEDHDIVQRARRSGVLLKILKHPVLYASLRRPEKIGYLRFITQYAISGLYTLTGEPIKKDLFKYPMGGHVYLPQKNQTQTKVLAKFAYLKKNLAKVTKKIEFPF